MVLLIHHSVSPQSRKVRLIMAEKKMLFVLKEEEPHYNDEIAFSLMFDVLNSLLRHIQHLILEAKRIKRS